MASAPRGHRADRMTRLHGEFGRWSDEQILASAPVDLRGTTKSWGVYRLAFSSMAERGAYLYWRAPGYHVTVGEGDAGTIDARHFSFGEWAEIGYWLDGHGYNQERYTVAVTFRDEGDRRGRD